MTGIDHILLHAYPVDSAAYTLIKAVWDAWKDLYAMLLIEDAPEVKWSALVDAVDERAAAWHKSILAVTWTQYVTPIMHEIVCHYGDFVRMHGPLGQYNSDGLECRHQPIKHLAKYRTIRKGFNAKGIHAHNTDIVQVMRRTLATEYLQAKLAKGKGARKASSHSLEDPLSMHLASLQDPVLSALGVVSSDEVGQA